MAWLHVPALLLGLQPGYFCLQSRHSQHLLDLRCVEQLLGLHRSEAPPTCVNMCIDMCVDMSVDRCVDRCVDMCVDRCIDMCIDMSDLCIDNAYCGCQSEAQATWKGLHAHVTLDMDMCAGMCVMAAAVAE